MATIMEMTRALAEGSDSSSRVAYGALKIILDKLRADLEIGNEASLPGFGRFVVRTVPAHIGRNPKTGDTVSIPERRRVVFKPSTTLKKAINERKEA